jgi:Zn-finger nucleic acid-binding protein
MIAHGSPLALEHSGDLDAWECPQHHGLGFTISEAYERMDEAEIHAIWQQARAASAGSRACPICTTTMVSVTVAPTAGATDEPTTDPLPTLGLDVCIVDEFIWFDAGELDAIPVDPDDPAPNPEEEAHLAEITEQFGDELSTEWSARDSETMRDHLIHRLGPHTTES